MMRATDIRVAARALGRQPGIALIAVLALALGIGLPAGLFSIIRSVLWRGLPIEDNQHVLSLERRPIGGSGEGWGVLPRDLSLWRETQRSFEELAAFDLADVALRIERGADRARAAFVSANLFDVLRARPAIGRALQPGDDTPGAEPVTVLSQSLWRDRFQSDPGVIGRTVFVDGRPHTVVGVMPEGFHFPIEQDLWVPLILPAGAELDAQFPSFNVVGRLRPGMSEDAARAEFAQIAQRVADRWPDSNQNMTVTIKSLTLQFMGETPQFQMYVLLAAVIGVLIIACINVANLLLVRAVQRVRELAVRAALGAGRGVLFGQLLLESALLAAVGGVLGVGVAFAGVRGLAALIGPDRLPFWAVLRLDGPTLLFVLALTIVAALVAGALPAIRATKASVTDILKDESRGASSLRVGRIMQGMVVLQIAISLALVINTGLMLVGLRNVQQVGLGFATNDVVTAQVTFPDGYDRDARLRFFTDVEQRIRTAAGVSAATIASALPTARAGLVRFALDGQTYTEDRSLPVTRRVIASDGFFDTWDVPVIRGRPFAGDDADSEPVVIVNQRFAVRFFPGGDALGQRIRLGNLDTGDAWRTIVGIAPDLWAAGLDATDERNPAAVYVPITQTVPTAASIAVRAGTTPAQVAEVIRAAVAAVDNDVPVFDVLGMPGVIEDNSWFYGMAAAIVGVCGFAALLLAIIGLYGVVAFAVGRRIREFGIRMAVGASPAKILALVLERAGIQIAIGVGIGVLLASAISRAVATLMFDVDPVDIVIFATVSAILILVNIAATWIPAHRAARTDPLVALRAE